MTQPFGYQAPPPAGRLVVDSAYGAGAFMLARTGPKIEVDGRPIRAKWGQWPLDLPAGSYHVRVSTRYLGEFGPAEHAVTVHPGQHVVLYYRAPAAMGMRGSIGFTPQKTRGLGLVTVLSVLALVLALVVAALLLS
ncbi:MAG: hypothetical protein GEV28_03265 [Actinophytocola sp.]|uniref:hypothetical protein n=1 Tax=Actinophytocola sp. TaxID=1872138 RepID=UPI0013221D3F|nr:hypothetical protein [Actinophytocola sp.]MPZ79453.1 hypothetical protein [Actinophytocola sp.]